MMALIAMLRSLFAPALTRRRRGALPGGCAARCVFIGAEPGAKPERRHVDAPAADPSTAESAGQPLCIVRPRPRPVPPHTVALTPPTGRGGAPAPAPGSAPRHRACAAPSVVAMESQNRPAARRPVNPAAAGGGGPSGPGLTGRKRRAHSIMAAADASVRAADSAPDRRRRTPGTEDQHRRALGGRALPEAFTHAERRRSNRTPATPSSHRITNPLGFAGGSTRPARPAPRTASRQGLRGSGARNRRRQGRC